MEIDLSEVIVELRKDLKRVNKIIRLLQELSGKKSGRGRKEMPESERQEVSDRMKAYWAKRHKK